MWIIVLLISGFFFILGFSVTKSNASYLLAGYNTMTEAQRKNFDIEGYLKFFRKFFLMLSISMAAGFVLLQQFISTELAFINFVMVPMVALPYLVVKSKNFDHTAQKTTRVRAAYWVIGLFVLIIAGLSVLFYTGLADNEMQTTPEALVLQGMYSQKLKYSEIHDITVTDTLPALRFRTNGFALGNSLKGYFRTEAGESVKLLVKKDRPPFLKIVTADGVVYWNTTSSDVSTVYHQIKERIP